MASITQGNDIFELPAERVALTSFRSAIAGYELGDPSCWDELWGTLVSEGGVDLACRLSGSLHYFVRALRASRPHKFNYFPVSCKRACADECLMLSLLSASQHNMNDTLTFCLEKLIGIHSENHEVQKAASLLSREMKAAGLNLMPVPADVIKSIAHKTCQDCERANFCKKLH